MPRRDKRGRQRGVHHQESKQDKGGWQDKGFENEENEEEEGKKVAAGFEGGRGGGGPRMAVGSDVSWRTARGFLFPISSVALDSKEVAHLETGYMCRWMAVLVFNGD